MSGVLELLQVVRLEEYGLALLFFIVGLALGLYVAEGFSVFLFFAILLVFVQLVTIEVLLCGGHFGVLV